MHIITVDGTKVKVMEAIFWLNDNVGFDTYHVNNSFPNRFWDFRFKKSEHAMMFALRWQR